MDFVCGVFNLIYDFVIDGLVVDIEGWYVLDEVIVFFVDVNGGLMDDFVL